MSRKFCITVYRALASPLRLQLWRGTVGFCRAGSSLRVSAPVAVTKLDAGAARRGRSSECYVSPPVAARQEPVDLEGRRICCYHSLVRSWKKNSIRRKGTARVAQHQSPPWKISSPTTRATLEKPSKLQRRQLCFRLCPRRRVQLRSTVCKHPWRRSSTILDMVPLSFLRNRIL